MFKLESYITPIILSYVAKYVKNFKPEQSQVCFLKGNLYIYILFFKQLTSSLNNENSKTKQSHKHILIF